jgi:uncharacterized protein
VPGQVSNHARKLARETAAVCWWFARVEVRSTLERLRRESDLSLPAYSASRQRLETTLASWREIAPDDTVRELAYLQLERFRLKAADALQLAAALVWCKQNPRGRLFVCSDERLTGAASDAGFTAVEI